MAFVALESINQDKKKVLIICVHNSARSQMAEGLLRSLYGDRYDVHSAGIQASYVDPRAVSVMNEIGIDISRQRSKSMSEYRGVLFDLAITVCDRAKEACPICRIGNIAPATAPAAIEVIHKNFSDPAAIKGSMKEQLTAFRLTRDEIKEWIAQTFQSS